MGCTKRSSLKNWKGREKGEDPGKDRKRKQRERSSNAGSEKMERFGGRWEKMESRSPQWAVVPTEEEKVRTEYFSDTSTYNKINYVRQHYLFLLIHKATWFDPSVGHLQAYIAD